MDELTSDDLATIQMESINTDTHTQLTLTECEGIVPWNSNILNKFAGFAEENFLPQNQGLGKTNAHFFFYSFSLFEKLLEKVSTRIIMSDMKCHKFPSIKYHKFPFIFPH